jgi:hypothetical protein
VKANAAEFGQGRKFLKSPVSTPEDLMECDADRRIQAPPVQKGYPENAELIDLVPAEALSLGRAPFVDLVRNRRSRRTFTDEALTLEELSFLLWAVQGIQRVGGKGPVTYRTVPASGGIHPFETHLAINRVERVDEGLYRYLPVEHKLFL